MFTYISTSFQSYGCYPAPELCYVISSMLRHFFTWSNRSCNFNKLASDILTIQTVYRNYEIHLIMCINWVDIKWKRFDTIKGPSINVNIFMSVQTIHFLRQNKNSIQQHFWSAKNPHENKKNQAKKLKVYGFFLNFIYSPP